MAPAVLRAVTLALRAVANVCPASPTCPQDDKCSYVSNGESFQINCATDFLGGDMGSTSVSVFILNYFIHLLIDIGCYSDRLHR
jgi:hypothetical protein